MQRISASRYRLRNREDFFSNLHANFGPEILEILDTAQSSVQKLFANWERGCFANFKNCHLSFADGNRSEWRDSN